MPAGIGKSKAPESRDRQERFFLCLFSKGRKAVRGELVEPRTGLRYAPLSVLPFDRLRVNGRYFLGYAIFGKCYRRTRAVYYHPVANIT